MCNECAAKVDITEKKKKRGKTRAIAGPCNKKKKTSSMNAQGKVKVFLLCGRQIAVKSWIRLPRDHHGTSFIQTNQRTASENILMAHAYRAHTGQIDGMLWL